MWLAHAEGEELTLLVVPWYGDGAQTVTKVRLKQELASHAAEDVVMAEETKKYPFADESKDPATVVKGKKLMHADISLVQVRPVLLMVTAAMVLYCRRYRGREIFSSCMI